MKTSTFLFQKLSNLKQVAQMSLSYNGQALIDGDDSVILRDAFYLWCLTIWDLAAPDSRDRLYDTLPQLFLRLCRCDIALLVGLLDDIRSAVYNLPLNTSPALDVFKGRHLGGSLYSGHIIMPLQEHSDRASGSSMSALNTLLCFLIKLNIKLDISVALEEEYVSDEHRLSTIEIPDSIADDLNKIIINWFKGYKWEEDFNPRHGPGAVSGYGRIPLSEKYPLLGTDQRLEYWLSRERPSYLMDYVRPIQKLDRTAQVVFVPKSLKTYRVICKEPATLQYWQQSVSSSLAEYIHNHPVLSRKISLDDQEKSRRFCLEASRSRDYATIDLSKASDTVSLALVKRIFRHTPLLRALIATRSDSVLLPSGEKMRTAKFAPMGSALCFPIECIIFAAACELAIAYSSGRKTRYRVYGDDIIIHREHVPNLMAILDQSGFLPNKQKSYWSTSCSYRESCGMEALDGVDISPTRLSRWFTGLRIGKDIDIPRLIDLSNSFFYKGFSTARRAVLQVLLKLKAPPLFSVPNGIGIWSYSPTNFPLKRKKYHGEIGICHGALISKCSAVKLENEDIRLHEWYRMGGNPDGPVLIEQSRVTWQAITSPLWFSTIEVAR